MRLNPHMFWVRDKGACGSELFGITKEELKEFEGKRVRVVLAYEGFLERADYGDEFVIRDGCVRYLKRARIEYIQEGTLE